MFGVFVSGLELLGRFPDRGFGLFECFLGGGFRFGNLGLFALLFREGLFRRFVGVGGLFDSFGLSGLIRLRRLQRGAVEINLCFGKYKRAFALGGGFLRVTVALQPGDFLAVVCVPESGDFVRSRRGETLAIGARGHGCNRRAVLHLANHPGGLHVPESHRTVFAR